MLSVLLVSRRLIWITAIGVGSLVLVVLAVLTAIRIPFSSDTLRKRVVSTLAARLDSDVELDSLILRFHPNLHAVGTGLTIHHHGRRDVPPLIAIRSFTIDASIAGLWRRRVDRVKLDGLTIQVPPGRDAAEQASESANAASVGPPPPAVLQPAPAASPKTESSADRYAKQVIITELEAPDAQLIILRADASKPARTWKLHTLRLRSVGRSTPLPFESVLTNAVPPGEIETSGTFGPWQVDDPGETPLDGRFRFDRANLGVFKGISGTLSAHGTFGGTLDRIAVDGQTDTPDFTVSVGGHPVPLTTTYHAVVDGTNGDTTLDPVHATFLSTSLVARGGVYEVKGVKGRIVKLDVTMENGRLEDVMRLAVSTPKAPMVGGLSLTTAFAIPPGKVEVVDKLQLDGRFAIEDGRFTDAGVQTKVNELSRRARGRSSEAGSPSHVTSDFTGRFTLGKGRLALAPVTFDVPGAVVELSGVYGMRRGTIAFNGYLFMDAKISQTMTGFKSLLLKMADPLFRREGRTVVPLKVEGTRSDPHFGLDVKRVFNRSDTPSAPGRSKKPSPKAPPVKREPLVVPKA